MFFSTLSKPLSSDSFKSSISAIVCLISGTASSAAAEGVAALKSAVKSEIVKSISWPTAEITGIEHWNIA